VALLPTEIPASREPGLRLNPQLRRIPAEMRADLTSAEIAMSGSYFDDVLRDPRRYGMENTTDKVRRPGAVRRRRDAVCTERIVAHTYKAEVDHEPQHPAFGQKRLSEPLADNLNYLALQDTDLLSRDVME
jgi:hypothetical protein